MFPIVRGQKHSSGDETGRIAQYREERAYDAHGRWRDNNARTAADRA